MTATTARNVANGLVVLACVLLAIDLAAMVGWLPFHDRSGFWLFAVVCLMFSRIFRRESRNAASMAQQSEAR